jgi:hypothetical protein
MGGQAGAGAVGSGPGVLSVQRCRRRAGRLGRARRQAGHDVVDLVGVDGLQFKQGGGHGLDLVAVVFQQLARARVLLVDHAANLDIHLLHGGFRHVLVRGDGAAEEDFALLFAVHHRPEGVGHAPLRHHAPRQIGGALEVVGGAGGHLLHEQFFGDAAAEQDAMVHSRRSRSWL